MSTDPLTGALQRADLASAFASARRSAPSVGLLLLDLDEFKSINDAFGHAVGDAVLQEFGTRARSLLRVGDILVRYGGDEFVVLLPNVQLQAAHNTAERFRLHVTGQSFPTTPPLSVTLSIGCAVSDAGTADLPLSELLELADSRLYQAKRQGRNRVVSSEDGPSNGTAAAAIDAQGRLIERDGAFSQALHWLDALSSGERGLLRVTGAPGVGMSRFLGAVGNMARLRGFQVCYLAGNPSLRLRQYGAFWESSNPASDGEPFGADSGSAAVESREATGCIVIMDRVSEIDTATVELIRQLVVHPAAGRVGVLVGLYPGDVEVGRLPDLPVRAEVRLHPFSLSALQVWLRSALRWEAPPDLSRWLHAETDGYPALMKLAVRQLSDDGVITRSADADWQVSPLVQEYPLREWLLRARAKEEDSSGVVRPFGQLVGRSAELRALKRAITEKRVVLVAGQGGIGKTHLAMQALAELGTQFADGLVVVSLAATAEVEFVAAALARALGLAVGGRQEPLAVALEYLAHRQMLIVFDTVEHLPGIGRLFEDLTAAAPFLRILATTRDGMVAPADTVIELQGLRDEGGPVGGDTGGDGPASVSLPHAGSALEGAGAAAHASAAQPLTGAALLSALASRNPVSSAGALFLQASAIPLNRNPPTEEILATIDHICALVHGYPLAIKMMASWTAFFGYDQIAKRLDEHLRGPTVQSDETDSNRSPMDAVFGFFWTLVAERDRQCIGGLALFRGGFTVEAAFAVADVTPFLLAALYDRAFIQTDGSGRYHLHELLRQHAWNWLRSAEGAAVTTEARHAAWCAELARQSAADMRGPHFREWVERLEAELDNLRSAIAWALDHEPLTALSIAMDLTEFWLVGIHSREGRRWIESALARAESRPEGLRTGLRVRALGRLGLLERGIGEIAAARAHLQTAVSMAAAATADNGRELALSLSVLANLESDVGAHDAAVALARQALSKAKDLGSLRIIAMASNLAVWPFVFAGAFDEATRTVETGLQASNACGDHRSTANLINAKATIAYYDPTRHGEAIDLYQQTVDLYEQLHDWGGLFLACNNLGSVYVDDNEFELAAHAFADARRIGQRVKQHRMMANVLSGSAIVASVRGDDAAAWVFWRKAIELALAANNVVILEECAIGLAFAWARAGMAEPAAVVIGLIGQRPEGKPWLMAPIARASEAARPILSLARWEALLAHGAHLELAAVMRLIEASSGPHDAPESILPASVPGRGVQDIPPVREGDSSDGDHTV